MKTPLNILIEKLEQLNQESQFPAHAYALRQAIQEAEARLPDEEQAIKDAWEYGHDRAADLLQGLPNNADEYFNSTYKQH